MFCIVFLNMEVQVIYDCNIRHNLVNITLSINASFDIICMFCIVLLNMEVHVIYDCNIRS